MERLRIWIWTVALLVVAGLGIANAQVDARDAAMARVAARSVGVPDSAVEVSNTGTVLTVVRIGSGPNISTHEGRNNEATAIATAIAAEIARKPGPYSGVQSIRIDYVERTALPSPVHERLVDRMVFRRTPDGKFELHVT